MKAHKIRYLMVHCSATKPAHRVTADTIRQWHMGPAYRRDAAGKVVGQVTYKGQRYNSLEELPKDLIGNVMVRQLQGRGWDRVGYATLIQPSGAVYEFVAPERDGLISQGERTWGAVGEGRTGDEHRAMNFYCRHVCLVGGIDPTSGQPAATFTEEQYDALAKEFERLLGPFPWVKITGHNQSDNKACPSFFVPTWAKARGFADENIDFSDPYGYASALR